MILRRFRTSALWRNEAAAVAAKLRHQVPQEIASQVKGVQFERQFLVDSDRELTSRELVVLEGLLRETFEPEQYGESSFLEGDVHEVGPRLSVVTSSSTNAVAICQAAGLTSIRRIEQTRRYKVVMDGGKTLDPREQLGFYVLLHDRMTEQIYDGEITSFGAGDVPPPVGTIPILERGADAIREANEQFGLAINPQMADYIAAYTRDVLGRDQTDVELVSFGQLNSQHCRHPQFKGLFVIDGKEQRYSLFEMIKATTQNNPLFVKLAYEDNAAALRGRKAGAFIVRDPATASPYVVRPVRHAITLKVETHNHPTAIEPFAGAATGTGGEIRDRQLVGRGGIPRVGLACYYVGSLFIPGYVLPGERELAPHPDVLQEPLQIAIQASNGASDYGNKFGQPIILGSFTSFEHMVGDEHYGWRKTCMVAGGLGHIRNDHVIKQEPKAGYLVVQLGGAAYRIGLGGGSASSKDAGAQSGELDFNSVQRADPEMETRDNEVIRACSDLGLKNPIVTGTDLGAGGESVALAEVVFPHGARYELRRIPSGDPTMPHYVLWCNESQERLVVVVQPEGLELLRQICERNRCPMAVVGEVTGDGKLVVTDESARADAPREQRVPVELDMRYLLADLPRMTITCGRQERELSPLEIPKGRTVGELLEQVLRVPKVASKHWLTSKVDRSVGGLVAQQQTVGRLQLPLADCAVLADGFFDTTGTASAIGEQPVIGLVDTCAGGRMSVGEALTNIMWAPLSQFSAIAFSATWQWPCGQPGEDARLYDTVRAVSKLCVELGLPIPVGKDSLSMTAWTMLNGNRHPIKAPGTVQMVAAAPCSDIRKVVTPDIKRPGESKLMFIDLSGGRFRLGGSVLAQTLNQVGNEAPDVDARFLKRGVVAVQRLIKRGLVLSGHDRSDGGLIVCLLEMAFAGDCGFDIDLSALPKSSMLEKLFAEELGAVIEYLPEHEAAIRSLLEHSGLRGRYYVLGQTIDEEAAYVKDALLLDVPRCRQIWFETGKQLDMLQTDSACAEAYVQSKHAGSGLRLSLSFEPKATPSRVLHKAHKPCVAVLREEGTNGHRELGAAFHAAGFEAWDVTLKDIADGRIGLSVFHGLAIAGGFSFSDVFDAGKGMAAVIRQNRNIWEQFQGFLERPDTFVLGVCNGCQAMSLLGLVPWQGIEVERQPRFVRNACGRFVHELVTLQVLDSPSIFLKGMEGSNLGIWVAHGEGRLHCPDETVLSAVLGSRLAPLRYVERHAVDDEVFGVNTEAYPFNPNGSPQGIAALTSPDGRFLALMPHPERLFQPWQWPYWPQEWNNIKTSPWLKLFQNARMWCEQN